MKSNFTPPGISFRFVLAFLLFYSCSTDDAGTDTDGPTPPGFAEVTTKTVITFDEGDRVETGGDIKNSGGSAIRARGVCWSTEPNPTIDDAKTSDGTGEGEFSSSVSGLVPNTQYYLRAYATNEIGTSYGGEVDFFTGKIIRQDVLLTSQEEVNAFGAQEYLTVIGNLSIGSTEGSDITDLRPLNGLNQVRGELVIGGSARSGDGFIRLSNPLLENLDGLETLALIGPFFANDFDEKALRIEDNVQLTQITGLEGLGIFEGDLIIRGNTKLESLAGLERLKDLERLHIVGNTALTDLDALMNLNSLRGSLVLSSNENLGNVAILGNLSGSIGSFVLGDNPLITDLDFMNGITGIQGNLILKDGPMLTDIEGLNGVQSVGGFLEINNIGVTSLNNLNAIKQVGQYVLVRGNPNLETLRGLNGLEVVDQYVEISSNDALIEVSGFNALQRATGTEVTSLGGITLTNPAIRVSFNDRLELLDGFESLTEAAGDFFFGGDALNAVTGFENLRTIEGDFAFSFVNELVNIAGFASLETIGEDLRIQQNRQIRNLDFLTNVKTVGGDLSIFLNDALSDFCGLETLARSNFSGAVLIEDNAFNPNLTQIANGNCAN